MDVKSMDRRYFLKITGIAGILAARQAPAFAQGSTLHWVRWVDFIPESDLELNGQMLGHTFGDAPTFTYPMTWAFGAAETDKSGKKVVLQSKGAVEAVKFMQGFWKECCDEGGLAWDDTNNNRAFHAGEISATLNG